jgi:cytochrome c oxidase subunit 2
MRNKLTIYRWLPVLMSMMMVQSASATDPWRMNMYRGVTPVSHEVYWLHVLAMWFCVGIGVVVFGVMIYALIHHRKSKGYKAADFHENIKLEIFWTVIPIIILIALAIPATRVLMKMDNTDNADLTIKVVGYQWKWQYEYMDQGIHFYSMLATPYAAIRNKIPKGKWYLLDVDKPLVVPVGKKIRLLVTSNDVIHSWWVPKLGVKRDAIPGFMHETWAKIEKPGIYRGQCTELCGLYHGFMPIVVKAVSAEEFAQWSKDQLASQDALIQHQSQPEAAMSRDELMSLGKQKYEQYCLACHGENGEGLPPLYPALKRSSIAVGHPISRHIDLVLLGVSGSAMQAYADQLTDEEIAAIITYERNAWENHTNDEVQPEDVRLLRISHETKPTIVNKARAGGLQ